MAPCSRWLAALAALCLVACGGEAQAPDANPQGHTTQAQALAKEAQTAGKPDPARSMPSKSGAQGGGSSRAKQRPVQRPAVPAKVFDSSRVPLGPWFDALAARFSVGPEGDNWPTEVAAPFVEIKLAELLLALGTDNKPIPSNLLSPDWKACRSLLPSELTTLRDDAILQVVTGTDFAPLDLLAAGQASGEDSAAQASLSLRISAHWRELLQPLSGPRMQVQVQVIGCRRIEKTRFETLALVRLWGPAKSAMVQINLRLNLIWDFSSQPRLVNFEGLGYERVLVPEPVFAELTRPVIPSSALPDSELMAGGVEYGSRHDRAIPFTSVNLGMHGMGIGDVDGDGLEDVYVGRQGGLPNLLLQHQPDGTVRDVARTAGVDFLDDTGGVLVCDLDGDGARDLAMGIGPTLLVCWNDGEGNFPKRSALRLVNGSQVYSLCAADADGDGDLDLYDTRYFAGSRAGAAPTPYHDARNGASNAFWRQEQPRTFVDATQAAGLDHNNNRFSLAALWEDMDGDGDLDLYVSNDFGHNNLYLAQDGRFHDAAEERGAVDSAAGMGVSVADVELDGDLDLYVSNMHSPAGERVVAHRRFQKRSPLEVRQAYLGHVRGNSLLLGDGQGHFERAARQGVTGPGPGGWAWGAVFCDFDGDGLPDIVVPNGFVTGRLKPDLASFFWRVVVNASPQRGNAPEAYLAAWRAIGHLSQVVGLSWNGHERNYGYWNLGGGRFVDVSSATGLDFEDDGRVVSPCDWDLDGRLDLWIKNRTSPALRFLHGRLPQEPHWIGFELQGDAPNTEAVGALVQLQLESGARLRARVYAGYGYLGSPSKRLRMGIPPGDSIVSGTVTWPLGMQTPLPSLATGALYQLTPDGKATAFQPQHAAMDVMPHRAVASGVQQPVVRVPSLTSVPLKTLQVPGSAGSRRSVASFQGNPLLLTLWGSWDEASLDFFGEVSQSDLASRGLQLWPISLDKARHWEQAKQALAACGVEELGGRADLRTRKLFELISAELIGSFEDIPLPLSLLLDAEGSLVCAYFGAPSVSVLGSDLQAIGNTPVASNPLNLTGGQWVLDPPRRRFEQLITWLTKAGEDEFADQLRAAAAR